MFYRARNSNTTGVSGIGRDIIGRLYFTGEDTGYKRFPLKPVLLHVQIVENRNETESFSKEGAIIGYAATKSFIGAMVGGLSLLENNYDTDLDLYLEGEDESGKVEYVVVSVNVDDKETLKSLLPYMHTNDNW